mmetsp:Transcript_86381/g.268373  ORF Transcript_86381/g.268373 Transcript_86381/m.268373 type:complete len:267 (+) Transcript_86381:267-1067(+)
MMADPVPLKVDSDLAWAVSEDVGLVSNPAEAAALVQGQADHVRRALREALRVGAAVIELKACAPEVGHHAAQELGAMLGGARLGSVPLEEPAGALLVLTQGRQQQLVRVVEPQLVAVGVAPRGRPPPVDAAELVALRGRLPAPPLGLQVPLQDAPEHGQRRAAGAVVGQNPTGEPHGAAAVEPLPRGTARVQERRAQAPIAEAQELGVPHGVGAGERQRQSACVQGLRQGRAAGPDQDRELENCGPERQGQEVLRGRRPQVLLRRA